MIDVHLETSVCDGARRFDLAVRFATGASRVALYGPSGAGKSLTLQSIAGLREPVHGHVRVGGRTLFDTRQGIDLPVAQRRVGYLFQNYALFPHLSVRDNVAFGLTSWWRRRLSAHDAARVDALLQGFGLTALARSRPAALSGGQQQRVALARALACEPALLLLDEPFAALNPLLRQDLRQELAQACAQWRIPLVMITHDVDDVLALADVAFVIEHGRAVREVDVSRGQGREIAQEALAPGLATAPAGRRQTSVRALLGMPALG